MLRTMALYTQAIPFSMALEVAAIPWSSLVLTLQQEVDVGRANDVEQNRAERAVRTSGARLVNEECLSYTLDHSGSAILMSVRRDSIESSRIRIVLELRRQFAPHLVPQRHLTSRCHYGISGHSSTNHRQPSTCYEIIEERLREVLQVLAQGHLVVQLTRIIRNLDNSYPGEEPSAAKLDKGCEALRQLLPGALYR